MPTLQLPPDVDEAAARQAAAIGLFQEGLISIGKAAELAGLSQRVFLDALRERGIPAYTYTREMLDEDLQFVREARQQQGE